ncbi:MAG: hypothetical protein WCK89_01080 [bacterium]
MTFQTVKKWSQRAFILILSTVAVLSVIAFCPAPIEGNWLSDTNGCLCDSHNFVRFEAGKILSITEHNRPPYWFGNYKRLGWGRYKVTMSYDGTSTVVRSSALSVSPKEPLHIVCRDPNVFKCRRILNQPKNEWVTDSSCLGLSILNVGGETIYYLHGTELKVENLEPSFSKLMLRRRQANTPIAVYTQSNASPSQVLIAIASNGFESVSYTNQTWIADVQDNSLVVRRHEGETSYWVDGWKRKTEDLEFLFSLTHRRMHSWTPVSAVFVPEEGVPESLRQILSDTVYTGSLLTNPPWHAASDPMKLAIVLRRVDTKTLFCFAGKPYKFKDLEEELGRLKDRRMFLNLPFVIYVENAVVPQELATILSRVGCEYETRPIQLLRRKK